MTQQISPKHLLFLNEYHKRKNPAEAAIKAGYSPRLAATNGPKFLAKLQQSLEVLASSITSEGPGASENSGPSKTPVPSASSRASASSGLGVIY